MIRSGKTRRGGMVRHLKASSAYAAYALALPFKTATTDRYWVNGTSYAALSSAPGYAYTRSGQVGFVNSAGFLLIGSFTSHVTGNVGRLANGISQRTIPPSGFPELLCQFPE